jgi:hypothetical protein
MTVDGEEPAPPAPATAPPALVDIVSHEEVRMSFRGLEGRILLHFPGL